MESMLTRFRHRTPPFMSLPLTMTCTSGSGKVNGNEIESVVPFASPSVARVLLNGKGMWMLHPCMLGARYAENLCKCTCQGAISSETILHAE